MNDTKRKEMYPTPGDAVAAVLKWKSFQGGKHATTWTYHKLDGQVAFHVARFDFPVAGKQFRPIRPAGNAWAIGDPSGKLPLYGLPELNDADPVYVVEGEKCVDAARSIGLTATTSAHGSKTAAKTDWSPLAGKDVVVLPDNDEPGRGYAKTVADILHSLDPPAVVRVVELPGLPEAGDIVDYIEGKDSVEADGIRRNIEALADSAPLLTPSTPEEVGATEPLLPWHPFPTNELPRVLRTFVAEGAASMNVDESFLALPVLGVCASAIGTTRRIQLNEEWFEPSILWAAVVAKSGQVKSPPQELALKPVRALEDDAFKLHATQMKDHEQRTAEYEVDLADWKKRGRRAGEERPERPEEPVCERFAVADCTIEGLAPLLEQNSKGLLMARDELAAWINSFDQYRRGGADVANWVELYGGRTLTVDRKTSRTIRVRNAGVSVVGTVQPRTLARVFKPELFECGFAARLPLLAMPPPRKKRWSTARLSPAAKDLYALTVRKLFILQHGTDANDRPVPIDLPLTPEAQSEWIAFYGKFAELQDGTRDDDLSAVYAKLEGAAARIALVFHLVGVASGDVTEPGAVGVESIKAGTALAWWFAHELKRVYRALIRSREDEETGELVAFIRGRGGKISPRELTRSSRRYQPVEAARDALDDLVQSGRAERVFERTESGKGGPKEVYRLTGVDSIAAGAIETPHSVSVNTVNTSENGLVS